MGGQIDHKQHPTDVNHQPTNAPSRTRTLDPLIKSQLLYQLS